MRPQLNEDRFDRLWLGPLLLNIEWESRIKRLLLQLLAVDEKFSDERDIVIRVIIDVYVDLRLLQLLLLVVLLCTDPSYLFLVGFEELAKHCLHVLGALCFVTTADLADQDRKGGHNVLVGLIILPVDDLLWEDLLYDLTRVLRQDLLTMGAQLLECLSSVLLRKLDGKTLNYVFDKVHRLLHHVVLHWLISITLDLGSLVDDVGQVLDDVQGHQSECHVLLVRQAKSQGEKLLDQMYVIYLYYPRDLLESGEDTVDIDPAEHVLIIVFCNYQCLIQFEFQYGEDLAHTQESDQFAKHLAQVSLVEEVFVKLLVLGIHCVEL